MSARLVVVLGVLRELLGTLGRSCGRLRGVDARAEAVLAASAVGEDDDGGAF